MASDRKTNFKRVRRQARVRLKVRQAGDRPRLSVHRSLNHIYAQVIDDAEGRTLAFASTLGPELREQVEGKSKSEAAKLVGELVARRAREAGVSSVVFDRGSYKYHGRVKALAEAAREAGLIF